MTGFLLIAPTGSGKSWVCENDSFFLHHGTDGDSLIDWPKNWSKVDWNVEDRKNLEVVLDRMRKTARCVLWYVGTTAIEDALNDRRLNAETIAIVLPPPEHHRRQVDNRGKRWHDWSCACKHRTLCENLVKKFDLPCFGSFQEAVEYVRTQLSRNA